MLPIELLNKYYGYDRFRPGQFQIIKNILNSKDVMAVMPTGAGKSICYQIPALISDKLTIVISPLVSLMKDQVDNLNNMGINAEYINSSKSMNEIKDILKKCRLGKIKLLYIAPERLESSYFVNMLKNINIFQVAVDEAHCVSMWGHDFRDSYLKILPFIKELKERPVVTAFTATATEVVRKDIVKLLGLKDSYEFVGSFDRENLEISVYKEIDKLEFIKDYIKEKDGESGIIYCSTRKEVEYLYNYLREYSMIPATKYHGGMDDCERHKNQEEFLNENFSLIIATNAFGMGIDKSNVRYIIHATLPKNIESYYQEIGRAGRDGEKSQCHLLYNKCDIRTIEYLITSTSKMSRVEIELRKLNSIIEFAESQSCYREYLLKYFGEENVKDYCSNCSNCLNNEELRDFTIESQMILSCVFRSKEKYGISVLIDILRGIKGPKIISNKLDTLTTFGIMKDYNSKFIRDLIKTLIDLGLVSLKEGTYSMLKLNDKSFKVLLKGEKVICKLENEVEEKIIDKELFDRLKVWRKERAFKEKIKPYIIFSDSTLIELSNNKPESIEELMNVRGMGEKKLEKYGDEILKILNKEFK